MKQSTSLAPTRFEQALGLGALALLAAVMTALLRGRAHWGEVPVTVWLHLVTIIAALVLTPVMLWRRRGDRLHRQLGYVWVAAMGLTAAISFAVRGINHSHLSIIHLLSAGTLLLLPRLVLAARRHDIAAHRRTVRGMALGALLIAGFFTFPFGRMMGRWLFGV